MSIATLSNIENQENRKLEKYEKVGLNSRVNKLRIMNSLNNIHVYYLTDTDDNFFIAS